MISLFTLLAVLEVGHFQRLPFDFTHYGSFYPTGQEPNIGVGPSISNPSEHSGMGK